MANKLRHTLIILYCLLSLGKYNAQNTFFNSYGGSGNDFGENISYCMDSGFVIVGGTESYGNGLMDLYILKIDSSGDVDWHKTFGGPNIDYGKDIIQTNDSGYIACGYSNSQNMDYDIFLVKTNQIGNHVWTKRYGGDNWDFGHKIIQSKINPNEFFIVGQSYSYGNGNGDGFVLKINAQGDSLWMKTYGGTQNDLFNDILEDQMGNLYATGSFSNSTQESVLWLTKLNSLGDTLWNFKHDSINSEGKSITKINNKLIFCGNSNSSPNNSESKYVIGSLDTNGQTIFDVNYNYYSNFEESCIKVIGKPNSNNYHLIANYFTNGENLIFRAELSNQSQVGTSFINGNGNDFAKGADTIPNQDAIIICGTTEQTINGFTDIFISKTVNGIWNNNFNNNLLLNHPIIKNQKSLIYPNPSYDIIKINGTSSNEKILVFDSIGLKVDDDYLKNGCYSTKHLKSGLYWICFPENNILNESLKLIRL